VATHRPADDFAGEEIEHDGQIEPPFPGWHAGDVGEPNLIRPLVGTIPELNRYESEPGAIRL
jgi:hypothetical protein